MKKLFRAFLAGILFALGIAAIPGTYAAGIALFGAPGQSNAINWPPVLNDLNRAILAVNTSIANYLTLNNSTAEAGEVALSGTNSFVANGAVATTMTSLGPTGSHTTIQEWVVFVDPSGTVRYIPAY